MKSQSKRIEAGWLYSVLVTDAICDPGHALLQGFIGGLPLDQRLDVRQYFGIAPTLLNLPLTVSGLCTLRKHPECVLPGVPDSAS
jgi:hypothetical protein